MAYEPWFPEPGAYIRYIDYSEGVGQIKYRRLLWRRSPMRYPRRFASVPAASTGTGINFDELNPATVSKKHIYLAYLGVCPGFLFYLYHPYDIKNLKWDEGITQIDENLVAALNYELSPYEFPTKAIGIDEDRYPGITPRNISGGARIPAVMWTAALYKILEHEDLSIPELEKLESGSLRSHPWDFGGEL